jgi:hypothetical protein
MTFRGMEVIFATCVEPDRGEWRVYGILARTRVIFQTLVLSDPYRAVVSILAHADTGLVAVAQAHATVQTYGPVATAAWPEERHQRPVTTLGRYIWKDQCTIHCNSIFCRPDESHVVFVDRRHGSPSTSSPTTSGTTAAAVGVDLSLSSDQKVLVAFRNQLAVFDVSSSHPEQQAELVWTTRLELDVITAKFSGDGLAICLVVKGEGVENDNPFGVRTFIRDEEDGSANASDIAMTATSESSNVSSSHHPLSLERTKSIGVIYQPGPFLVHTAPVSRISFRGLGHVTSNVLSSSAAADNEGNDLLLTYCNEDCSVRVFNQNGWKQLMHWTTPPNSRADWVKGISAFTLGDLDATPMKSKFTSSAASSRRTSFSDTEDPPTSAAATGGNTNHSTTRSAFPPPPTSPAHPAPSSAAGAWIAELTFRNAFPALRLSRLSYMKRGDDDVQPSHFESVAAILPAGSIVAGGVLDGDDAGLSVHGVWPAWNPCTAGSSKDVDTTEPMTGSAMAILGMSAAASHHHPSGAYYGQSVLGGTHSPPSELKIIASHPLTGKVLIMEFPLWGDRDLGAMELGSPLRYLLSLADVGAIAAVGRNNPTAIRQETCSDESKSPSSNIRTPSVVSVEYESSRLCAQIEPDSSSVAITWRRHAGISVLPESFVRDGFQGSPFVIRDGSQTEPTLLQDITNISVPLSLPPLRLPHCCTQVHNNKTCIVAVCWWPDENFGGPPLLLVVTSTGTILVFEIPPPWSAMEPSMPNYDPSLTDGSVLGDYSEMNSVTAGSEADNDHDESFATVDYEVSVTPDPDFGLGLRLESYEDSSPTVVGSFKKHPLHGGRLPAEKSGKISLGDELLFVNNVDLEGMSFDNVIETVRRVGAEAGAGAALSLRFRRRKKFSTRFQHSDSQDSPSPANRRTAEQIFSLPSKRVDSTDSSISSGPVLGAAAASQREPAYRMQNRVATVLVGAGGESQQEFSRIIAIVDKALPDLKREDYGSVQSRILISPWTFGNERPSADHNRGSSVLVYAQGRKIYAKRLDVASDCDPERARLVHIGSCKLGFKALQDPESNGKTAIQRLIPFETGKKRLCFAACDDVSEIRLVFVDFAETEPTSDEMFGVSSASFREYLVVQFDQPLQMIRAFSPELFVTLSVNEQRDRQTLRVWSPTTNFASFDSGESPESPLDEYDENCYVYSEVSVPLESANEIPCQNEIIDVVFTRSGCLDAHPWLIAFSRIGAVVYQRLCGKSQWSQVLKIAYSSTARSDGLSSSLELNTMIKQNLRLSPVDTFPHLLPSLILMISSSDESNRMRSDWHPDALLACLCSDQSGVKETSRSTVREILLWVAESLTSDEGFAYLQSEDPLKVIPSKVLQGLAVNGNEPQGSAKSVTSSTGPFAIGINSQNRFVDDRKEETLLRDFQHKLQEVDKVPSLLQRLTRNERNVLHVLVDLVLQPPDFGSLDVPAQLTLFCVALLRQIKSMPDKEAPTKAPTPVWPFHQAQQPSFAQTSPANTQKDRDSMVASSAVLSALASCSQGSLLEACRFANEKLDWARAKELRLPFWIRSDQQLRKISEEIGQRSYQQRRDIMESALFFVAVRNMRTLRNLAATDSSESGRKFSSFISNFDFASARGRQAAEKNAYSLLRKRRFGVAATFFLLPDPPMLNSAIETIATKMEDLDLAFFVTRLVESTQARESTNSVPNLAQFMGGGGGYAASAEPTSTPFPDDQKYHDWKPSLRKASRQLLLDRGVPSAVNDRCLTAVQFIWLGQPEKASQHLASNASISSKPDNKELGTPVVSNGQYALLNIDKVSALDGVKSFIDFASTPFNLEAIGASSRSKWASTIRVSSELSMRGIDVPSIGALLGLSDLLDQEGNAENSKSVTPLLKHNRPAVEALPTPSIFDQYDVPSTIFDSFDAMPPPRSAQAQTIAPKEAATASSIFDSFDVPPPARTSIQKAEPTASSIFGAFDTPAQNTASRVETTAPSIFDSFDVPAAIQRPAPKTETKAPSIFDSFDVPASALAPPPTPRTEAKESSIFDSFDVASGSLPNQQLSTNANDAAPVVTDTVTMPEASPELPLEDCKPITRIPPLWREWRTSVLLNAIARRLIREIVATISLLYTDLFESSLDNFSTRESSKSASVNEILHRKCDGNEVIAKIRGCVDSVCVVSGLNEAEILDEALHLLASPCSPRRTVLAVLLHCAAGREDLAEDNIRHLAHGVIQYCEFLSLSNDDVVNSAKSICHFSSTCIRQRAASASWQLETCLWLHRGGAFPLSQVAMSEAIVAVRVGLVIAAWNRDYDCLDAMLRCEPDCEMDRAGGSQLWGSLKMLAGPSDSARKHAGQSNGGWEFLVETRRAGATEMLKSKSTGCFIIRPHRDDDCVFTLSFKTNLVPTVEANPDTEPSNIGGDETTTPKAVPTKIVKEDDVVQHAVVRLSDSGFRCGSFGPFPTLMQLLEAVSSSLPFPLRFDQPPVEGLMGGSDLSHPSPNAVFLLKLATDSHAETLLQPPVLNDMVNGVHSRATAFGNSKTAVEETDVKKKRSDKPDFELRKKFGRFAELLLLSEIRKQLSSIAAAAHDSASVEETTFVRDGEKAASIRQSQQGVEEESDTDEEDNDDDDDDDSLSESNPDQLHIEMQHSVASRTLRPLLVWCRSMEISAEWELAPALRTLAQGTAQRRVTLSASETAIELAKEDVGSLIDGGDAVLRRMIQPGSGVEFRTLRLGEGGHSAVVVLFSQSEAIEWFISTGAEATKESAMARLKMMESRRVIEPVDLKQLGVKAYSANKGPALVERGIRYRFVDPWEVEAVGSKEGEIKSATLGRAHLRTFDLNLVSQASENVIRSMGGVSLLKLWDHLKGGIALTKAIASIHPPWERGAGGDLQVVDGTVNEPSAFLNSVSQHLYRNTLFRRLKTPQRFLALIQIELLDLKNLTSPLGMSALTVYALLRLKRGPSGAPLHNKSRTLDSVATHPMKLGKTSGPNAPASWGSVVRFRFPLPEDVTCDAVSYDGDREALFKVRCHVFVRPFAIVRIWLNILFHWQGPPCVLQISVYEKKFMTDTFLGGADVKLDDLSTVGQLEEWVPLRVVKHGISVNWFARIRLTLRFELMCLHPLGEHASHDNTTTTPEGENEDDDNDEEEDETDDVPAETSTPSALQLAPSVGLRRIRELSRIGGADEDIIKKSASTPDLLGYFENMAY